MRRGRSWTDAPIDLGEIDFTFTFDDPARMTTPSEQSEKTGSFPLFDWLRFILASAVALSHEGILRWQFAGNFAVQVFFALSGWLIGGILLRAEFKRLPHFYYNR